MGGGGGSVKNPTLTSSLPKWYLSCSTRSIGHILSFLMWRSSPLRLKNSLEYFPFSCTCGTRFRREGCIEINTRTLSHASLRVASEHKPLLRNRRTAAYHSPNRLIVDSTIVDLGPSGAGSVTMHPVCVTSLKAQLV